MTFRTDHEPHLQELNGSSAADDAARSSRLASIAMLGFGLFIAIMTAFHFIQPELDPLQRYGSEYAVGRLGWLMNVAFFCLAIGLASLAMIFGRVLSAPARSRVGGVLLALATLGILGSGIFNADLQGEPTTTRGIGHIVAGLVAFASLSPGMIVVSRRLRKAGRLHDIYRFLTPLAWLHVLLFVASMFFEPYGLVGLGQRIQLATMFLWLLLAAQGLRSAALTSGTP